MSGDIVGTTQIDFYIIAMEEKEIVPSVENTCRVETFKRLIYRDGAYFVEEEMLLVRTATDEEKEKRIKCGVDTLEHHYDVLRGQALSVNKHY